MPIRESTLVTYTKYTVYWVRQWATLGAMTEWAIAVYVRKRLKEARGKTVSSELSAMRRFLEWCVAGGKLKRAPAVPPVSRTQGKGYKHRRRCSAPEYSPQEIEAIIERMPERSRGEGWVVRARAIVAYETSLRPGTLEAIRCPDHYTPGSKTLLVIDDADKEAFGREVILTERAQKALDSVCPEVGLIFGRHRLDPYAREAAEQAITDKVLPGHKGAVFTMQHLRSASLTHALEAGASLPGMQWQAGHKHVSTTAKYVKPSYRAAEEAMRIWGTRSGDGKPKVRRIKR